MEKQLQLRRERLQAGEKPIGWKVGFGAPASMARLKIKHPLIAFLTDRALLPSGTAISVAGWIKPAVEPEIAVHLGRDLPGNADRESAKAAIASIGPAIEIADIHFPPEDVERVLAANIYNRHVIIGRADSSRAGLVLDGLEARIERDEIEIAKTSDLQALTGDILDILWYAANLLSLFGENMHGGEFIIMGSVIPPIWIESNTSIQYRLQPVDSLQVRLMM